VDGAQPLSNTAEAIAYEDLSLSVGPNDMAFRAQMMLLPLTAGDETLRAEMAAQYDDLLEMWGVAYANMLNSRGLKFRSDVTPKEFAIIITAVSEGLAMRAMVEGPANVMDNDAKTSLLGIAALALFSSFVDTGDHHTVRQLADHVAKGEAPDTTGYSPHDESSSQSGPE
jgi:hypothetical protein